MSRLNQSDTRIVDSQIHLFGPGGEERAYRLGQGILNAEAIIAAMDDADVGRAYLVPVGSAANSVCLDARARWPDRFRVMGVLRLNQHESRELIVRWQSLGYSGVRLSFPPFRDSSWLADGTADWFWPAAEKHGIPVMIWAPGQLPAIAEIGKRYPRLKLVVDHLGLSVDDKGEAVASAVEQLVPLSGCANIAVKASALPAHSIGPYPYSDMHPVVERVLEAFGEDRVFWGSDLTRLPCTLSQAVSMFTTELDFLKGCALQRVMGGGITDWIGW